jgi:antitoxin CptB
MRRARGLQCLIDLPDTELLDLLLRRTELPAALARPEVAEVLDLLRRPPPPIPTEGNTP